MPLSAAGNCSGPKPLAGCWERCEAPSPPFVRRIIARWRAALFSKHPPSSWQKLCGPPPPPQFRRFDLWCLFHQRLIRHHGDQVRYGAVARWRARTALWSLAPFPSSSVVSLHSWGRKFLIRDQSRSRQIAAMHLFAGIAASAGVDASRRSSRFGDAGAV